VKRYISPLFVLATIVLITATEPEAKEAPKPVDWYPQQFPFMKYRGVIYTFETEFDWPDRYHRPDSASLTDYQYWISHFPLWSKKRKVTSLKKGVILTANEIARPVHLPWRYNKFTEVTISLQVMIEFLLNRGTLETWPFVPRHGDKLTYGDWLRGVPKKTPRRGVYIEPGDSRPHSEKEVNSFLSFYVRHTNFKNLAKNLTRVSADSVRPGDLYLCHDEKGINGKIFVIMCMLQSDEGEPLYAIGTGCEDYCEFYIPTPGTDRDYPWHTVAEIQDRVTEYPVCGFYRPFIE
jgi:hypothetical protein